MINTKDDTNYIEDIEDKDYKQLSSYTYDATTNCSLTKNIKIKKDENYYNWKKEIEDKRKKASRIRWLNRHLSSHRRFPTPR